MIEIRYVQPEDKVFWYRLDRHLPEQEFDHKVRQKRGYVLWDDDLPIGLLRYNLFWDNTPFCTMLYIDGKHQGKENQYLDLAAIHVSQDMRNSGMGKALFLTAKQ